MQKIFSYLSPEKEEEGALDFSFGGIFRCMLCPHPKVKDEVVQLAQISNELDRINEKLTRITAYVLAQAMFNKQISNHIS